MSLFVRPPAWFNAAVALRTRCGEFVERSLNRSFAWTQPAQRWWQRQPTLSHLVPTMLFVATFVWYFAEFSRLVWLRHSHYGTFDYDLGMYDQGIWQMSHGRLFMTVRGMDLFAHHANIGYILFVPFYWIGIGGPQFLNMVNTFAVVAVTIPLFSLGRRHLRSNWAGLCMALLYLFHFAPQWKIQETFHPESLAAPFFVGAFYFATVKRWGWYWACVVAALMWKEDIAIAVAMLSVAVAIVSKSRKHAGLTLGVGVLWFVVATQVFMPAFQQNGAVFDALFGPLGATSTDVVKTSVEHPSRLVNTLNCHGAWTGRLTSPPPREGVWCPDAPADPADTAPYGAADLARPYGYFGVLGAPAILLTGLPQHVINYSTVANFTWDLRWHYAMMPFLAVMLASMWTVARRKRAVSAWFLLIVMAVGVFADREAGVGPWTTNAVSGNWPIAHSAFYDTLDTVVRSLPEDAAVSVPYFLVPHLSHREHVYTFPNPWVSSNYGVSGVPAPPSPSTIDYVVVNRVTLNASEGQLFEQIESSGEFVVEREVTGPGQLDNVTVLKRVSG